MSYHMQYRFHIMVQQYGFYILIQASKQTFFLNLELCFAKEKVNIHFFNFKHLSNSYLWLENTGFWAIRL